MEAAIRERGADEEEEDADSTNSNQCQKGEQKPLHFILGSSTLLVFRCA